MNKRICIFGVLLFIVGILTGEISMEGYILVTVGPVVIILGVLLDGQKSKDGEEVK